MKFRAYDIEKRRWCTDKVVLCSDGTIRFTEEIEHSARISVQFFTGLLDKNAKEIYAGDIVKNEYGGVYQIRLCPGGFECLEVKERGNYLISILTNTCEVVGNIYDHEIMLDVNLKVIH